MNYTVDHEFDDEPTYVLDEDGEAVVTFSSDLPASVRLTLAYRAASQLSIPALD